MSSIHDCTLVPWSIAIVRRRENGHDLPGGHEQHWRLSDHSGQSGGLHQVQYGSMIWFNDVQWHSEIASKESLPKHCSWAQLKPSMTSWCARAMRFNPLDWLNFLGQGLVVEPPVGWKTGWNHLKGFETTIPLSNDYCFNQNFCACGWLPNVAWVYCSASWMASLTWHFLYLLFLPATLDE